MERPQREENLNVLTHGVAALLSVGAAIWMVTKAYGSENRLLWIACLLYGLALIGLFTCSTLSHWAKTDDSRRRFRQLDQAFIYFLIVATYTPFSVAHLHGTFFWILLGAMWLVAITGFVAKLFRAHRVDSVSVIGYVALGWMPALGGVSLFDGVPSWGVLGILGGGVLYTSGVYFLLKDKQVWYYHAIWHVFVIAGAAVHWWTTMTFVV